MTQADSIRRYLGTRSTPQREQNAQVTVVAAGKGGVGASTVAALLAAAHARAGARTLLVDAEGGSMGVRDLVGSDAAVDTMEVTCLPLIAGLTLALPPVGRSKPPSDIERRVLYRRVIALFTSYDAVVVDAGTRLDTIAGTVTSAGALLVVTATDRIALAAAYAALKVAAVRAPGATCAVLINRTDEHAALTAYRAVSAGAERFLGRTPAYAGWVPEDDALRAAVEAKQLLETETQALHTLTRLVADDATAPRLRVT